MGWVRALAAATVLAPLLSAPAVSAAAESAHPRVDLPGSVLERYTGDYQLGNHLVLHITRMGDQLYAQLTGQGSAGIFPETVASFVYRVADARIDFIPDPPMQITALVLHQNGSDYVAPRIDAGVGTQLDAGLARRLQQQSAAPGSVEAAHELLAGIAAGAPDFTRMTPDLADATRAQLPQLQGELARLGPVQSVQFQGVGNQGWDLYSVQHERGSSQLRILMSPDGRIAGALLSAGP
jgi:hypothetical protein